MLDRELQPFLRIMIGMIEKGVFKETFFLENESQLNVSSAYVIFIIRPTLENIKTIIRLIQESEEERKYVAFVCPRYTVICNEILEENNVLKSLIIRELPYELIPIENDVLCLEDNSSFKNLSLGIDYASLSLVKHSLQRLEALYGKIPLKYAKGAWSVMILDALSKKEKEPSPEKQEESQYSEIDALIMIDRTVDLFTPLMTQITYEGVIDEFFGIKCGTVDIDEKILETETKGPTGKRTLMLQSKEDIMFGESRDLHFNMMKTAFPKKFQEIKSLLEKKDAAKTVAEMTEYMKKLRNLKIPQVQAFFSISIPLHFNNN